MAIPENVPIGHIWQTPEALDHVPVGWLKVDGSQHHKRDYPELARKHGCACPNQPLFTLPKMCQPGPIQAFDFLVKAKA